MPETQKQHIPQPFFGDVIRWAGLLLFRLLGGLTVIDADNVPLDGPVLICPNHLSNADTLAVYSALPRRDVYFVANQELFDTRFFGAGLRAFGSVPIHRETADRAAIRQAVGVLAQGSVLVLFPEGHLSESGHLNRILPGAALIASRAQAEIAKGNGKPVVIVPVGLSRTNCFLPYGATMLKSSHLPARVVFGQPILLEAYFKSSGGKQIDRIIGAVEREIRRLTGQ